MYIIRIPFTNVETAVPGSKHVEYLDELDPDEDLHFPKI